MDVLTLVLRYVSSRRVSFWAMLFVAIGVAANTVVVSVMDGFQDRVKAHVRGTESDLTLSIRGYAVTRHLAEVERVLGGEMEKAGGDVVALAPHRQALGMVANTRAIGGSKQLPVRITGIDFRREAAVIPLRRMMTENLRPEHAHLRAPDAVLDDPFADQVVPGLMMGTSLADALDLRIGDDVQVVSVTLKNNEQGETTFASSNKTFRLVACFDSGREDYDSLYVYMTSHDFGNAVYGGDKTRPDCSTVQAKVADPSKVQEVKRRLAASYPTLEVVTWEEKNRTLLGAIKVEKMIIVIILFFIIAVAAGSILGILNMMVSEKRKDIGILRSMGMSSRRVTLVFLGCGAFIGLVGSVLGTVLGLLIAANVNAIKDFLARPPLNIEVFSAEIYRFKDIPTRMEPEWIGGVALGAFLLATLAGAISAAAAARLDPVRCLKDQ